MNTTNDLVIKCPKCSAENVTDINLDKLSVRYTPYPVLCWHCHSFFEFYIYPYGTTNIKIRSLEMVS